MPTQKLLVNSMGVTDEEAITTTLSALDGTLFAVASHSDACVEVE